ncbi:calvin cycle protein CP12-1, chloroplastic [Andrographis paniculata]|uniref:calvin cycle protein CP12-1, chloroplastic n=1 Tax=Andrographis paniculata TaxID=175694 RepID=UPI0021E99C64|nr:calvin cycle protein CP12-1, chloroplastic [Andrographis paniculata]
MLTMAAAAAGVSAAAVPSIYARAAEASKPHSINFSQLNVNTPWKRPIARGRIYVPPAAAAPDKLSGKVEESIKKAEETCSDDPVSGECAAAWDEVEELSAAASHARDRQKESSDPLENFCKDNPETDECRTYDN